VCACVCVIKAWPTTAVVSAGRCHEVGDGRLQRLARDLRRARCRGDRGGRLEQQLRAGSRCLTPWRADRSAARSRTRTRGVAVHPHRHAPHALEEEERVGQLVAQRVEQSEDLWAETVSVPVSCQFRCQFQCQFHRGPPPASCRTCRVPIAVFLMSLSAAAAAERSGKRNSVAGNGSRSVHPKCW
jgi:hypothetical protein